MESSLKRGARLRELADEPVAVKAAVNLLFGLGHVIGVAARVSDRVGEVCDDISVPMTKGNELVNQWLKEFWTFYIGRFGDDGFEEEDIDRVKMADFLQKYVNPQDWEAANRVVQRIMPNVDPEAFLYLWLQSATASAFEHDMVEQCRKILQDFMNGDIVSSS